MIKTNLDLVKFVESKLNFPTIYMLGGFGRKLTHGMVDYRINKGCRHTLANEATIRKGVGDYVYDCVGIIKGGLWETSPGNVRYNIPAGSDQNVGMMYRASKKKGPINTMPDVPGMLVFTADLGHVGVYVGKKNGINQYVESTPAWGAWGVTTSADRNHPQGHNRKWSMWGEYALIDYIVDKPKTIQELAEEVLDGKHGNGAERRTSLGDRYDEVQKRVNEILAEQNKPAPKTIDQLAQEVLDGKHGDGAARRASLGTQYDAVQKRVNEMLATQNAAIAVNDKVKIIGTKYATGQNIPLWVKRKTYIVQELNNDRALLKEIRSWVFVKDLTKV